MRKRAVVRPLFLGHGAKERSQKTWEEQLTNFALGVQTARRSEAGVTRVAILVASLRFILLHGSVPALTLCL